MKWIPSPHSAIPSKNKQFCRGFFSTSSLSLSESPEPLVRKRPAERRETRADPTLPLSQLRSCSHYATLRGDSLKTFWRCKLSLHLQLTSAVCHSQKCCDVAAAFPRGLRQSARPAFPRTPSTAPTERSLSTSGGSVLRLDDAD